MASVMMMQVFLKLALSQVTTSSKPVSLRGSAGAFADKQAAVNKSLMSKVADDVDWTDITAALNDQIAASDSGSVYSGGTGVIFRDMSDGFTNNQLNVKVVPGTLIVNDIFTPNIAYCLTDGCPEAPVVGAVFGDDSMKNLFGEGVQGQCRDYDDQGSYNLGVFYASDSNAIDQRCRYEGDDGRWDCRGLNFDPPSVQESAQGYFDDANRDFTKDPNAQGTSSFPMGNPYVITSGGGGTGYHMKWDDGVDDGVPTLDQSEGCDDAGTCLVKNHDAECNYNAFVDDENNCNEYAYSGFDQGNGNCWDNWVQHWIDNFNQGSLVESWKRDLAICWNYCPRDMINLQNWFWLKRDQWWKDDAGNYQGYWGWNEIPVDANYVGKSDNIKTIAIVLPTDTYYAADLKNTNVLEDKLDWYVQNEFLKAGAESAATRPGSYITFVRQWKDDFGNFQRYFFCENLKLTRYQIVYVPPHDANPTGACYFDNI